MINSCTQYKSIKPRSFFIQIIIITSIIIIYLIISCSIQILLGLKEYDNIFFVIQILTNKIPFLYTYLIMYFIHILFPVILGIYFMNNNGFNYSSSVVTSGMIGTPITLIACNIIDRFFSSRISGLINFFIILVQTIFFSEYVRFNLHYDGSFRKTCFFGYMGFLLLLRSFGYNIMYHLIL
ncbi:hypothetical protein DMUE_2222 [Dictyocoela muelleri]|nr:hypothetical protein DMUE_2222 [Dictyocoela muelleri]